MTKLFLFMLQCYEKNGSIPSFEQKITQILNQLEGKLIPQLFLGQGTYRIF